MQKDPIFRTIRDYPEAPRNLPPEKKTEETTGNAVDTQAKIKKMQQSTQLEIINLAPFVLCRTNKADSCLNSALSQNLQSYFPSLPCNMLHSGIDGASVHGWILPAG